MEYKAKPFKSNINVSPASPLKDLFVMTGGIVGIMFLFYLLLGFAVDFAAPKIPLSVEEALSSPFDGLYANALQTGDAARINRVLAELREALPEASRIFRAYLVEEELFNAMALPGGHIVLFSELMDAVESDNELAFVLAHELGHFIHHDHLRGLGRGLVLYALLSFALGPDHFAADFIAQSLVGVQMRFSREQETRADLFALDLLQRRYQETSGAIAFMKKIGARQESGGFDSYFASHPHPLDRMKKIKAEIERLR